MQSYKDSYTVVHEILGLILFSDISAYLKLIYSRVCVQNY